MYEEIDISKLPTKGVYYEKDVYLKVRMLTDQEVLYLKNRKSDLFMEQLHKLEYSLRAVDTNMDVLDICYTDVFYLYYKICAKTYHDIPVNFNGKIVNYKINSEDFMYTNPDFSKQEDMFYDKLNIKFYHPSIYNMSKANINIIQLAQEEGSQRLQEQVMLQRLALVPYLQKEKISDNALDFVNEHMMSFSDAEILEMKDFKNEKENLILGQRISNKEDGEDKELLIQINQLL